MRMHPSNIYSIYFYTCTHTFCFIEKSCFHVQQSNKGLVEINL